MIRPSNRSLRRVEVLNYIANTERHLILQTKVTYKGEMHLMEVLIMRARETQIMIVWRDSSSSIRLWWDIYFKIVVIKSAHQILLSKDLIAKVTLTIMVADWAGLADLISLNINSSPISHLSKTPLNSIIRWLLQLHCAWCHKIICISSWDL